MGDPLSQDRVRQRIRRHRTATVTLTVTDSGGRPLPDTAVAGREARFQVDAAPQAGAAIQV